MASAADVYAAQLLSRRLGYPLWLPEPTKFGEVQIGDVGFVQEGRFYRLFNAVRAADDPVNAASGVPIGFTPLVYNERMLMHTVDDYLPPGPLMSSSTRQVAISGGATIHNVGLSYAFAFKANQGALAVLGDHATQSLVLPNSAFARYIQHHHASWADFALAQQLEIPPDAIVLVSGWLKTSAWALAACTDFGRAHELSLAAQDPAGIAGVKFGVRLVQNVEGSLEQRSGPRRTDGKRGVRDQCIFLRYYKVKSRPLFLGRKVVAGAGSRSVHSFDEETRAVPPKIHAGPRFERTVSSGPLDQPVLQSVVEECGLDVEYEFQEEPTAIAHDPINDLLDFILDHSDAKTAVANHEDLFSICNEDWPDDFPAYFESLSLEVEVDSDGIGRAHRAHDALPSHTPPREAPPTQPPTSDQPTDDRTQGFGLYDVFESNLPPRSPPASDSPSESSIATPSEPSDASSLYETPTPLIQDEACPKDTFYEAFKRRQTRPTAILTTPRPLTHSPFAHRLPQTHSSSSLKPPNHHMTASAYPPHHRLKAEPDQYSSKVLAVAPLAHILVYRACVKAAARFPHAAGNVSVGLALGAVAYREWKQYRRRPGRGHMRRECSP